MSARIGATDTGSMERILRDAGIDTDFIRKVIHNPDPVRFLCEQVAAARIELEALKNPPKPKASTSRSSKAKRTAWNDNGSDEGASD